MLTGDFHYPINDGTLPLDRVALLDVWKEIFMGVAQDQQLRSQFDVIELFKYTAELGGAKNIERFQVQAMPDQQVMDQMQAGNMKPMEKMAPATGVEGNPGQRLMI